MSSWLVLFELAKDYLGTRQDCLACKRVTADSVILNPTRFLAKVPIIALALKQLAL
jgi:hypothetical protein